MDFRHPTSMCDNRSWPRRSWIRVAILVAIAATWRPLAASPYIAMLSKKVTTPSSVVASAGALASSPGMNYQSHLIFANASGKWWLFYLNATTTVLRSAYSTDLINWTASTTFTVANSLNSGANFTVAYKNISGTDVVHVGLSYIESGGTVSSQAHVRGTISSTSITWGTEAQVGCSTSNVAPITGGEDGPITVFGSDNKIYDFGSARDDDGSCGDIYSGNIDVAQSTNADVGTSWTAGWTLPNYLAFSSSYTTGHLGAALTSGNMLVLESNGQTETTSGNVTNMLWSKWNGTTWSATANVLTSSLGTAISSNDVTGVQLSTTNYVAIFRTGANTYVWRQFNGSSWSTPAASIPNQNSLAGSGPFLATDGTNIWLFIIDTDSANTLRYVKYNGSTWGSWTAIEASTQARSHLTGYPVVTNGYVGLHWTQTNGSNYDLVVKGFAVK
jgi:hypothetical protein